MFVWIMSVVNNAKKYQIDMIAGLFTLNENIYDINDFFRESRQYWQLNLLIQSRNHI